MRAGVLDSFKASGSGHRDLQQADALASSGPGIMSRDSCELRAGFSMSWELLWAEIVLARRGSIFFHAVFAAVVSIRQGRLIRILFRTVYLVTAHRLSTKRIARVVEEPRAGIVLVGSYFRVGFFSSFFGFLVWWIEQSQ